MTGAIELANRGSKTISVRTSGFSFCCTVLLGVTMAEGKLPPFIIFKGKPNGRIAQEWTDTTEFLFNSFYVVQENVG